MTLLRAFARGFNLGRLGQGAGEASPAQAVVDEESAARLGLACGRAFRETETVPSLTPPQLRALVPTTIGDVVENVGEIQSWPYQGDGDKDMQGAILVKARAQVGDPTTLVTRWLWRPRFSGVSWRLQVSFGDPIAKAVMSGRPIFYLMDHRDLRPDQRCYECQIAVDDGIELFAREAGEGGWRGSFGVCARCVVEIHKGVALDAEGEEVAA